MEFSVAPTSRKSSDFETAWNIIRNTPAHKVSGVPVPAQATIRPRFDTVDIASTRFASLCAIAINEATKNVKPPISATSVPVTVPLIAGESLKST